MDKYLNRVLPIARSIKDIADLARVILNEAINNAKKGKSTKVQQTRLELLQKKQSHLLQKLDDTVKLSVMKTTYLLNGKLYEDILTGNVDEIKTYLECKYGGEAILKEIVNLRTNNKEYQNIQS